MSNEVQRTKEEESSGQEHASHTNKPEVVNDIQKEKSNKLENLSGLFTGVGNNQADQHKRKYQRKTFGNRCAHQGVKHYFVQFVETIIILHVVKGIVCFHYK